MTETKAANYQHIDILVTRYTRNVRLYLMLSAAAKVVLFGMIAVIYLHGRDYAFANPTLFSVWFAFYLGGEIAAVVIVMRNRHIKRALASI